MTSSATSFYERMRKANVPTFGGGADPEKANKWIRDMERNFRIFGVPDDIEGEVVVPFLVEDAEIWWEGAGLAYMEDVEVLTWEVFKGAFLDQYFPSSLRMEKVKVFFNLKQTEEMSVVEYAHTLNPLGKFVPEVMGSDHLKMMRFKEGLLGRIQAKLSFSQDYADAFQRSIIIDACIQKRYAVRGIKRPRPFKPPKSR